MSSDSEEEFDHEAQTLLLEQLDIYASNLLGDEKAVNNKKNVKIKNVQKKEKIKTTLKSPNTESYKGTEVKENEVEIIQKKPHQHEQTESYEKMTKICPSITEIASNDRKENDSLSGKKKSKKKMKEVSEKDENNMKKINDIGDQQKRFTKKDIDKQSKNIYKVEFDVQGVSEVEDDDAELSSDISDDDLDELDSFESDVDNGEVPAVKTNVFQRHLEDLKKNLGLTEQDFSNYKKEKESLKNSSKNSNQANLICSKGGRKRTPPEVIVFEDPAKRTKKSSQNKLDNIKRKSSTERTKNTYDSPEFDLISAKHEVHQFGIDGLDKLSKEEATVKMLIKLGAKPPKKKCINYKELMKQKKEQEEKSKAQVIDKHYLGPASVGGNKKKQKGKASGKAKRDFGDGQIGKYKDGVQFIKAEDIKNMKPMKSAKRKR